MYFLPHWFSVYYQIDFFKLKMYIYELSKKESCLKEAKTFEQITFFRTISSYFSLKNISWSNWSGWFWYACLSSVFMKWSSYASSFWQPWILRMISFLKRLIERWENCWELLACFVLLELVLQLSFERKRPPLALFPL